MMTPQNYLQAKLDSLCEPVRLALPANEAQLVDTICALLLSKKFRKYAVSPEVASHIVSAVRLNVAQQRPINLTLQQGAFKLWRLAESPEVDWAELFALAYYTKWVRSVCQLYKPGVLFDFYIHDLIIPVLNNIPVSDTNAYVGSYRKLLEFLKPYQPHNLEMSLTLVSGQFTSTQAFGRALEAHRTELAANVSGGLVEMSDADRKVVELNVKITPEQQKDPRWQQKVWHLHTAYLAIQDELGYREGRPEKILVSTLPVAANNTIAVGTTKSSIMKFWLGAGLLKANEHTYQQVIYSPAQLEKASYAWEPIQIDGLSGRNFSRLRVVL